MNSDGSCPIVVSSGNDIPTERIVEKETAVGMIIGIVMGSIVIVGLMVFLIVQKLRPQKEENIVGEISGEKIRGRRANTEETRKIEESMVESLKKKGVAISLKSIFNEEGTISIK